MSYLDDSGLAYFWSKLKTWANSVFALVSHTHAASDVTAMTGYSMPQSSSAISSGDTLNQAVGKLEKAISDADVSNVVHRTGAETIDGIKTFNDVIMVDGHDGIRSQANIFNDTDSVSEATYQYVIGAWDANNNSMADIYYGRHSNDTTVLALRVRNKDRTKAEYLQLVYWASSDVFTVTAPTPPSTSNGGDVSTTSWVRTFGNNTYLPLTGGVLTGPLTGTSFKYKSTDIDRADTTTNTSIENWPFHYLDKNNLDLGNYGIQRSPLAGSSRHRFRLRNTSNQWADLVFEFFNNGKYQLWLTGTSGTTNGGFVGDITGSATEITDIINLATHTTRPSDNVYCSLAQIHAKDNNVVADSYVVRQPDGYTGFAIRSRSSTSSSHAYFHLWCSADGTSQYASVPTPGADSSSDAVATTSWVRTFCDTTRKYMKAVSVTGSGNAVTAASLSNGTLTLTKGSSYITSSGSITGSAATLKPVMNLATAATKPSSGVTKTFINIVAQNDATVADFYSERQSSGNTGIALRSRAISGTTHAYIILWCNSDGSNRWASAPSPTSSSNSTDIATTAWVRNYHSNASDERLKQKIDNIPDKVLDAWEGVSFCQFKFNESVEKKGFDNARLHTGVVAQHIDKVFKSKNLDISEYGLYCLEEWDAREAVYDAEGNVIDEGRPAGNQYLVRYTEALCMEAAYMRRENARLKKRVADLEDRLAALELRLGSE